MSNPKVFEFAKEVGLTPIALMDKIREWQIPVKSHMSELEPEVLEQIKIKLTGGGGSSAEAKPRKAATRKAPAKKPSAPPVAENAHPTAAAGAATPKSAVIRRKTKEAEEAEIKAKEESSEELAEIVENDLPKEETAAPVARIKEESKKIESSVEAAVPVAKTRPAAAPVSSVPVAAKPAAVVASATPVSPTKLAPSVAAPIAPAEAPAPTPIAAPAPAPVAPAPARKKEVIMGASGVASASTPSPAVGRKNIIGRMDLSRVSAPGRPQNDRGPSSGAPRPQSSGFNNNNNTSGGFSRPGGPTNANRNIRTGFVSTAMQPPEPLPAMGDHHHNRSDFDKRKKAVVNVATGPSAKEREQEEVLTSFNAVEFRKREMVFQPKKKKNTMDRNGQKTQITMPKASKRVLKVNGSMKLSDAAMEMGLKAPQLVKVLMTNGVMANMNTVLDFDTLALIVPEFKWEAQNVYKTAEDIAEETAFGDMDAAHVTRPPVVTVMGHVDHGKTSLLDAIRNADVAKGEAGGITQHIGAYSVKLEDGSLVTFLDTPGHEAFTAMRARGANATDIAVIVVAADDGMMPQTQEAINHAKAAGVPIIVAVNKIDKPGANPERIKQQLTELEIVPEEWGGTTIFVEVSALKKTGIKKLLENIKVLAEVQDLKANPLRSGTGIVIEAKLEKGKGSVATLLVKDGTVKVGQHIVAGIVRGRIRSLTNDKGERVQEIGPGFPVEVLGLDSTPMAGDKFDILVDEETAERVSQTRREHAEKAAHVPVTKMSLEDIFSKVKSGDVKELALVLKADVHGSLEAVQGMIGKISTVEVKTKIIHTGVGGINESDILLANAAKGIVVGFNVRPDSGAQAKAKQLGVDVRTYSIVYELIDDLRKAMGGLLTPNVVEEVMGRVEVRNIFSVPKIGTIAGCFVTDGKVQRNNMIRLIREGKIVYEGKLASLKRFKDDAKEVATGYECGISIENYNDIKVGDVMEAFVKKEVARELSAPTSEARP